jgi:hypothetical protein
LRARRGAKKAIGALAASILTTVYHMLISGEVYRDLGPDHIDRRAKTRHTSRLVVRLQNLGYDVQITPLKRAAWTGANVFQGRERRVLGSCPRSDSKQRERAPRMRLRRSTSA